jgi:hypothetical protein
MEKNEGAAIIREMITAITSNPAQFHFRVEINSVGQSVTVSGGGTGVSINATGGGLGSSTVGQSVSASVSDADIKIMQDNANAEINNQMNQVLSTMNSMAQELDKDSPNTSVLEKLYKALKEHWVPAVITTVIGAILKTTVGIGG